MPTLAEPLNLGDLLKYEAPNLYSRDRITVAAGQNLPLGTVLGIVTASGKYKQADPSAEDGTQVAAAVALVPPFHLRDRSRHGVAGRRVRVVDRESAHLQCCEHGAHAPRPERARQAHRDPCAGRGRERWQ